MLSQEILNYWDLYDEIYDRQIKQHCIPYRLIVNNILIYLEINLIMYTDFKYHYMNKFNNVNKFYGYFKRDTCRTPFLIWRRFYIKSFPRRDITLIDFDPLYLNIIGLDVNDILPNTYSYVKHIFEYVLPQNILSIKANVDVLDILGMSYTNNCISLDSITLCVIPYNDHWIHEVYFPNLKNINIGVNPLFIRHMDIILDFIEKHNPYAFNLYITPYYPASDMQLYTGITIKKFNYNYSLSFKNYGIKRSGIIIIPLCNEHNIKYPIMISWTDASSNIICNIITRFRPKTICVDYNLLNTYNLINYCFIEELSIIANGYNIESISLFINLIKFLMKRYKIYLSVYFDNFDKHYSYMATQPRGTTWRKMISYIKQELNLE